jgi:hypothetical protein
MPFGNARGDALRRFTDLAPFFTKFVLRKPQRDLMYFKGQLVRKGIYFQVFAAFQYLGSIFRFQFVNALEPGTIFHNELLSDVSCCRNRSRAFSDTHFE